jgi:predicted transcriptional regulator
MSETQSKSGGDLTYDDVLDYMAGRDWPVTSKLIAEHFDISQQAAYYRLKKLLDRGDVERAKLGRNVVLWKPKIRS